MAKKKRKRRKPRPDHIFLTMEELVALLKTVEPLEYEFYVFLLVTYWHAHRVSESLNLRGQDVSDGFVVSARLKGSRRTRTALRVFSDPLLNESVILQRYLRSKRPDQYLFRFGCPNDKAARRYADRAIKAYGKLAGIPPHKCHMHVLKHSFCQHWGPDIGAANVMAEAGLVNIQNAMIYFRPTDEQADEALRKAISG